MEQHGEPIKKKPEQINLDLRTDEQVRQDVLVKIRSGKADQLDLREKELRDKIAEEEHEGDQVRYGH